MRILILTNSDEGLYRFRRELLERVISEKHEVTVSIPAGDYVNNIKDLGCAVKLTSLARRSTNPFEDYMLIKSYRSLVDEIHPDLVLTYTIKPNIYGGLVCASYNIPYIANITGLGSALQNKGLLQFILIRLYRFSLRKVKTVFFQNDENEKFFSEHRIAHGKHKMLPGSGINLEKFNFMKPKEVVRGNENFLFVGRVMKDKGMDELLCVAEIIKQKYPNVTFNIVGPLDGPYKDILTSLDQKNIIRYWGAQSNVRDFYENCDAVILPTYHEGMSNVLLEAAACGRPVIASNIAGCREAFDDEITGIAVEPKSVDSLYQGILKFINLSSNERKIMGIKARQKMEESFDRNIIIERYLEEINDLEVK